MKHRTWIRQVASPGAALALLGLLLVAGCNDTKSTAPVVNSAPNDPMPDFTLRDVNPQSPTFGQEISPREYIGRVSAWYFGHSTWGYCVSQFGYLNQMEAELSAADSVHAPAIAAVNEAGQESGDDSIRGHIPWLQDTLDAHVWSTWGVTYRDVVILDEQNRKIAVFNLTDHNLQLQSEYDSLKALLEDAAR